MRKSTLILTVSLMFSMLVLVINFGLEDTKKEQESPKTNAIVKIPTCKEYEKVCAEIGRNLFRSKLLEDERSIVEFECCLDELDILGCPMEKKEVLRMMQRYMEMLKENSNNWGI